MKLNMVFWEHRFLPDGMMTFDNLQKALTKSRDLDL